MDIPSSQCMRCKFQHLAEAFGSLLKEKDKHFRDHKDLKIKLGEQLEEQAEIRRNYQQEVDTLLKITSKIKEYVYIIRWSKISFSSSY